MCSRITEFQQESEILMKKFLEAGYKASDTKEKIDIAKTVNRTRLLQHSKNSKNANRIPLVLSYNRKAPNVSKIMHKHWPIL